LPELIMKVSENTSFERISFADFGLATGKPPATIELE
jgi:hypothetical protein